MILSKMGFYLTRDFVRKIVFLYIVFFFLIFTFDLIELSRKLATQKSIIFYDIIKIAFLRAPHFSGQILPFIVLFAAMASFFRLNQTFELVIARASGISVWQILTPFIMTAAAIGLFSSLVYHSLALKSQIQSQSVEASVFTNNSKKFWLRAMSSDGEMIIYARVSGESGKNLKGVTAYLFTLEGEIGVRFDAEQAHFLVGENGIARYRLMDVVATESGKVRKKITSVDLNVDINEYDLLIKKTDAKSMPFWRLREQASRAEDAGRNPNPFLTQFHAMLSQPLLFVAMVLIAASFSLRLVEGTSNLVILSGILIAFMLYIVAELVLTFANNGLISPVLAAWSPPFVATLLSITILLHQEDG
ncbi:LptF/LptG family permease [Candidatus Endowatersipora endosymbiont of Watersipora subatra]|uniref:LptF/LptG family permease n=1 Tax=Candidatus Endowatersipora endosymbiont of Watersipora subatra TaxID=3077946 RepID=UPI00312C92C8